MEQQNLDNFTVPFLRNLIKETMAKRGKKITNLGRTRKPILINLIHKYKIEVVEKKVEEKAEEKVEKKVRFNNLIEVITNASKREWVGKLIDRKEFLMLLELETLQKIIESHLRTRGIKRNISNRKEALANYIIKKDIY